MFGHKLVPLSAGNFVGATCEPFYLSLPTGAHTTRTQQLFLRDSAVMESPPPFCDPQASFSILGEKCRCLSPPPSVAVIAEAGVRHLMGTPKAVHLRQAG